MTDATLEQNKLVKIIVGNSKPPPGFIPYSIAQKSKRFIIGTELQVYSFPPFQVTTGYIAVNYKTTISNSNTKSIPGIGQPVYNSETKLMEFTVQVNSLKEEENVVVDYRKTIKMNIPTN